jgi:3-hydroxyacyl-CoA dehydrogenase
MGAAVSPEPAPIERIGIVGGGFMGTGIAESAAVAGLEVTLRDVDDPALARSR